MAHNSELQGKDKEHAGLPRDPAEWPDNCVKALLDHPNHKIQEWAEREQVRRFHQAPIPPRALEKFDRKGPRMDRGGRTTFQRALSQATAVLTALRMDKEVKARVGQLLQRVPATPLFCGGPEAKEVGAIVRAILDHERLIDLLRKAEKAGRLYPGTADGLAAERRKNNPYVGLAGRIAWELNLASLDPDIRRVWPGRPGAFLWAVLADALADEVRKVSPRRVWPVVTDLLRPFIEAAREPNREVDGPFSADAEHLRQLVDHWKRVICKRVVEGYAEYPWDQHKAELRKEAGLE